MNLKDNPSIRLNTGDALIIVDVQNDFLPGGSLAVPRGYEIIPVLNRYIEAFRSKGLPIFATRDWHPAGHSSFSNQGGPWPVHCVQDSSGAQFAPDLLFFDSMVVVSKATEPAKEAYSGFEGTDLDQELHSLGVQRLFIGGLATDVCVLRTVEDALKCGYQVFFLRDASRAVNVQPEDGPKAEKEMTASGAVSIEWSMLD